MLVKENGPEQRQQTRYVLIQQKQYREYSGLRINTSESELCLGSLLRGSGILVDGDGAVIRAFAEEDDFYSDVVTNISLAVDITQKGKIVIETHRYRRE